MIEFGPADSLHRLVKQAIDSGQAKSIAEAEAMFRGYRLAFRIDAPDVESPAHQAALLTGIALARRVFLGGVSVSGPIDVPLRVPLPLGPSLSNAADLLGATRADNDARLPTISIGGEPVRKADSFYVRTYYSGWKGGIVPGHAEVRHGDRDVMPLAAMLSAGLAVNEAFHFVSGDQGATGRRAAGLSLWEPSVSDWLNAAKGPDLQYLPSQLWLIGLGHLGQAFLWGLGILPFPSPAGLTLILQDLDRITPSTETTSILSEKDMVGQLKTRAMANWCERRGFATKICERLFDGRFQRHDQEPAVALCGIDNGLGRRALDQVGFSYVVEAGLGRGHRDFRSIRLHTLPGPRPASQLWSVASANVERPTSAAYQKLIDDGLLDQCGVTLLAGKAVGAPFVGTVAATLVLAEVLRLLHGGTLHHVIDMDLASLEHRSVVSRENEFNVLNPGYVAVEHNSTI